MRQLLTAFANCRGVSGFESKRQERWLDEVGPIADEVAIDAYGNAVAVIEGSGPDVVVTTHADEIGYQVREIDSAGYLRLDAVGRTDETVARGRPAVVHTAHGEVTGVIGQTPVQLRNEESDGLYVDIGGVDRADTIDRVSIGDPVTIRTNLTAVGESRVAGRMDNSVGLAATVALLRSAKSASVPVTVVSTVQEEIGVRGARMIELGLDPDVFVSIDTDFATDHPQVPADARSPVSLGGGPVLGRGMANHSAVVSGLRDASDRADEPVQIQSNPQFSGTHADALYTKHGGVPTAKLGIPCRYMHTPTETIDLADLASAVSILTEFVRHTTETRPSFRIH